MRTVIVGDVHGCSAELETLLERIAFADGDRLVMVGDLVARGPDSSGVLAIVRSAKGRSALGNHEAKLLSWRRATGRRCARATSNAWPTACRRRTGG